MVNEILISVYLFIFRIVFNLFKKFPLKNMVTFVVSFGDNSEYVYREMLRQKAVCDVMFLITGSAQLQNVRAKTVPFKSTNLFGMIRSIYYLATSKYIIIDNYFGFLSAIHFREGTECIQMWHAVGAVKTFGLKDKSVELRSNKAKKRFLKVYQKFDKIVVGSEEMVKIFKEAFDLTSEKFLRTGIPRTDLFYDSDHKEKIVEKLTTENPKMSHKKVILYAPTYRDNNLNQTTMKLDLSLLQQELGDTHIILLRFHQAVENQTDYEIKYPGFVYDYSSRHHVNELLLVTDYLITDYSSVPYEYALLGKPMIFFPYDLEDYQVHRGLWDNYTSLVPGPTVFTTREVVDKIKQNAFDLGQVQAFAQRWNQYSIGQSSKNLVNYLFSRME